MRWWIGSIAACVMAQSLATVTVISKPVERYATLTAEIAPYQKVDVVARVAGYIEQLDVDRGSVVRKGQAIARLAAPELAAQVAEAQARVLGVEAQTSEARARLAGAESTAARLKTASQTPGAVAANEVVQAEEAVKAARALVQAAERSRTAAQAQVKAFEQLQSYLNVTAPFDGVVTERMLHPGALAGPSAGAIVRLEQVGRLRVIVAVPEANAASIKMGQRVEFGVSAYPAERFAGAVSRVSRALDVVTRTMPVELDVANPGGKLAPGMYTEVKWPARVGQVSLLVPATAIAATTERSFVIRVENGVAKYVNVRKGAAHGELVEVSGSLVVGDRIVQRATDEIREGTAIPAR